MAVYFPRGQQTFTEIKDKFVSDFDGVATNDADAFVFVTNQELRRAERKALAAAVSGPVMILHLERVLAVLDQPRMHGVREQFLGIAAPEGLDRGERLDELWRASAGRCEARWISVGLPEDEAADLAADPEVGRVETELLPSMERRLVVWTAPMGSGKSIASERHHQDALAAAATDDDGPLPVFLRAGECVPDLQRAVQAAASELGEPRRVGAVVVVDGVDEVGHQAAETLLTQARTLVRTWPNTTILMTSRSVPALSEALEHIALSPLTSEEQEECVDIGAGAAGSRPNVHSLAQPVRATLGQPMFALLVGLWMRERQVAPSAPVELMRLLGERATRGLEVDESHLRKLAILSVGWELGPVPAGEVLAGASPDDLLATGMLARRGDGLAFVLPAVAQWFVAQALLLGELDVERLLESPEDLELWRYPLALALSLGSAEQSASILGPLLDRQTGFAMRVLEATFGQAVLAGGTPPSWREGGRRVRETLQALSDAFGPLGLLVLDTNGQGRIAPMGVASDARQLTVAFWRGREQRPDVFELPTDFFVLDAGPEWSSARGATVGPGAAWAWNWSFGKAKGAIDQRLRNRRLPIPPEGPLADEAAWAAACDLLKEPILVCDSIELDRLVQELQRIPDETYEQGPVVLGGSASHDLRGLRHLVRTAHERGAEALLPPVPPADVISGGGWTGDFYSDERIVLVATRLYEAATVGYRQLVERWMPTLLETLEHHVLMPMRIVGFVSSGRGRAGFPSAIPQLAGYLEALPPGSADQVEMRLTTTGYDYSVGRHSYAQQRAARPHAARWLTGSHGGMSFEVGAKFPISDVVYSWIASDLQRLGLVGPLSRHAGRDAMVVWDL